MRALAVSSEKRSPAVPDLPTVAEAGVPGYAAVAWAGLLAPKGTPKAIVDRINAEVTRVMALPEVKERLSSLGAESRPTARRSSMLSSAARSRAGRRSSRAPGFPWTEAVMQKLSAAQAAALVRSGDTVAVCGVVSLLSTEAVLQALEDRFTKTAEPRDLSVITPCRTGWLAPGRTTGLEHFAAPGMVRRLIASSYNVRDTPRLLDAVVGNRIATYVLPMGVLFRWMRECAARSPGLLTQVGAGTFIDPAGGDVRAHPDAPPFDLLKRVQVDGIDCLFLRSMPIDVAIVRGTAWPMRDGNVSLEDKPSAAALVTWPWPHAPTAAG